MMWKCRRFIFLVLLAEISNASERCDADILNRLLNGIQRSIQYFREHDMELNLDSLTGTRMTGDQLMVLAENIASKNFPGKDDLMLRMKNLTEMCDLIIDKALPFVQSYEREYEEDLEGVISPGSWRLNYRTRPVLKSLQEPSLSCKESPFLEDLSDSCISQVSQHNKRCVISSECMHYMTHPGFREYALSHQVLYLELVEMHNCRHALEEMGVDVAKLQDYFCANILRDAEEIAERNYPKSHRDLFFEQIAVCGMFGYKDFWNNEWADNILSWQEDNGCQIVRGWRCQDKPADVLSERKTRKRNERILEDGCSVHATAVGLVALTVNLRFCVEEFIRMAN